MQRRICRTCGGVVVHSQDYTHWCVTLAGKLFESLMDSPNARAEFDNSELWGPLAQHAGCGT